MSHAIDPSPSDALALHELLELCTAALGGPTRLARLLGTPHSTVSQWTSGARRPDGYAVLVCARLACAVSPERRDQVLEILARLLDLGPGRWQPSADKAAPAPRTLPDRVLEVASLAGDLAGEARSALADGRLDDLERARLRRTVGDQQRALDAIVHELAGGGR